MNSIYDSDVSIAVGYCYYNDIESIKRSVPTFAEHVDFIIAVDGRFSLREGEDYSTDGSSEYLKTFPNVLHHKFVGMEHDKRNVYVEVAEELGVDVLIIIDSDEYVVDADWKQFRKNLALVRSQDQNIHGVKFYYNDNDTTPYPRIWVRPEEVRYQNAHCVFNVKGQLTKSPVVKPIDGISVRMNDDLRSEDYLKKTSEYQAKMIEYEKPYRNIAWHKELDERLREKKILLFRPSPRADIEEVEQHNANLPCDILQVKYMPEIQAYWYARDYFLDHDYDYLVIASDDMILEPEHIDMIQNDIHENNFQVISGMVNVDESDWPDGNMNITYELPDKPKPRKYEWITQMPKDNIFPVKFAGFGLTAIRRDVVELLQFAGDAIYKGYAMDRGASLDLVFCYDCQEQGIKILCDQRIKMKHLRNHGENHVGFVSPQVMLYKNGNATELKV